MKSDLPWHLYQNLHIFGFNASKQIATLTRTSLTFTIENQTYLALSHLTRQNHLKFSLIFNWNKNLTIREPDLFQPFKIRTCTNIRDRQEPISTQDEAPVSSTCFFVRYTLLDEHRPRNPGKIKPWIQAVHLVQQSQGPILWVSAYSCKSPRRGRR